mgnify:FL=1|tara:strand:- start:34822 stop:35409 length:588 start_codon:yes stop_codon:yes gene_type:complete
MANKDAPFGLRPIRMIGGGDFTGGQDRFDVASGYTTSLYQGDLVEPLTNGTIGRKAAGETDPVLGVFNGCRYTNPTTGTPTWANTYQQPIAASDIYAFVVCDPSVVYEVQADDTFPTTDLFGNFDIVDNSPVGDVNSGISHLELDVTTGNTTATLPLKAIGISTDADNSDTASANTNVVVTINNSVFSGGTDGLA